MSTHKNLPIYREAGRLVAHLHQSTRKAPRDLRHTLIQRLLDEATEVCVLSYLGLAKHGDTWNLRGKLATLAAQHPQIVAHPNRTKVMLRKEQPCPTTEE